MLFVPVLIITLLYLILYRTVWFKKNLKRKHSRLFFGLHVFFVSLSALLVLLHVFSKFPYFNFIPLWMKLSGLVMLLLFAVQFITGILMKRKPNPSLFKLHRKLPALLLLLLLAHAVVLKQLYF